MAERTGCLLVTILWPYVLGGVALQTISVYQRGVWNLVLGRLCSDRVGRSGVISIALYEFDNLTLSQWSLLKSQSQPMIPSSPPSRKSRCIPSTRSRCRSCRSMVTWTPCSVHPLVIWGRLWTARQHQHSQALLLVRLVSVGPENRTCNLVSHLHPLHHCFRAERHLHPHVVRRTNLIDDS